jgi:DNA-binding transcriptional regulator LsrR (DeoR family)/DNA-binding Xre family transcriptional regulator
MFTAPVDRAIDLEMTMSQDTKVPLQDTFGSVLRRIRDKRRLTRQALAAAAGITANYIFMLEKGERERPSPAKLQQLCLALELSEGERAELYKAAGVSVSTKGGEADLRGAIVSPGSSSLPDQSALISRIFWKELGPHDRSPVKVAELLRQSYKISLPPKVIETKLQEWEAQGWVEHSTWGEDDLPSRHAELEGKLLNDRRYPLRHVIVAKLPKKPDGYQHRAWDNLIHRWLGRMASAVFLALLREGDRVAVGSGRGPYQCVTAAQPPARPGEVSSSPQRAWQAFPKLGAIASLTGEMGVQDWDPQWGAPRQDADDVATNLASFLRYGQLLQVKKPLLERPKRLPPHLTWKVDDDDEPDANNDSQEPAPDIALVGIGSLAQGHRLTSENVYDSLRKDTRSTLENLRRAAAAIDQHVQNALQEKPDYEYHCVADLCNWLFRVGPPEHVNVKDSQLQKLDDAIKAFNDEVLSPSAKQLAVVARRGAVIAVAGGRHKKYAIRHVLSQKKKPWISHLVTDHETADWLCRNP